jgi:prepilin-type N-terminal cleavage/methylation domain-containing protein
MPHVPRGSAEHGFTLLEVVFAITITSIVIVAVGFSVTESLRNGTSARTTVDRSAIGSVAASYFASDVASSTSATPVTNGSSPECGSPVPTAMTIKVAFPSSPSPFLSPPISSISYFVSGTFPTTLFRRLCNGNSLVRQVEVGRTSDVMTATASACDDTTGECTLTLSWATPGTPSSFTLRGVRRLISG